jgi:hypothetical protein
MILRTALCAVLLFLTYEQTGNNPVFWLLVFFSIYNELHIRAADIVYSNQLRLMKYIALNIEPLTKEKLP